VATRRSPTQGLMTLRHSSISSLACGGRGGLHLAY